MPGPLTETPSLGGKLLKRVRCTWKGITRKYDGSKVSDRGTGGDIRRINYTCVLFFSFAVSIGDIMSKVSVEAPSHFLNRILYAGYNTIVGTRDQVVSGIPASWLSKWVLGCSLRALKLCNGRHLPHHHGFRTTIIAPTMHPAIGVAGYLQGYMARLWWDGGSPSPW